MTDWTQAKLDDLMRRVGQSQDQTPDVTMATIEAELAVPSWRRAMDPRDAEWLDRVDAPLRVWDD